MIAPLLRLFRTRGIAPIAARYVKFCIVGGTGLLIDMALFYYLTSTYPSLGITVSKLIAAEAAIWNNFLWNQIWTFKPAGDKSGGPSLLLQFLKFHAICLSGIVLSVALIVGQAIGLGINANLANFVAIVVVSLWNFTLSSRYGFPRARLGNRASTSMCSPQSIALIAVAFSMSSSGAQFEIQGVAEYKSFTSSLPPEKRQYKKAFTVSLTNCQWQIQTSSIENSAVRSSQTRTIGYDSTNLFSVAEYNSGLSNSIVAVAETGQFPLPDSSLSSFIWLAFCSSCYFSSRTNATAEAVWFIADSKLRSQEYSLSLTSFSDGLGLPKDIEFHGNGTFRILENGQVRKDPYPKGFPRSFLEGRYEALRQTNVAGMTLPALASFIRYSPAFNGTNLVALYEVVLSLEKVTPTFGLASVVPTMPTNTVYSERRFSVDGSPKGWFIVQAKGGEFPSYQSIAPLGKRVAAASENTARVGLARVLIAIVIVVPLVIWMLRRRRAKPPLT